MIVVADTSPPLHLARVRRLNLLPAVVGRVTIPRTVWGELVQAGTRPDVVAVIQAADWIEIVEDPVAEDLGLDPGGIVAGARRAGALERAAPVVAELRADGFWLSDALVAEFLRGLGESE